MCEFDQHQFFFISQENDFEKKLQASRLSLVLWNTFLVCLFRSAESATEVISLALHSVLHILNNDQELIDRATIEYLDKKKSELTPRCSVVSIVPLKLDKSCRNIPSMISALLALSHYILIILSPLKTTWMSGKTFFNVTVLYFSFAECWDKSFVQPRQRFNTLYRIVLE